MVLSCIKRPPLFSKFYLILCYSVEWVKYRVKKRTPVSQDRAKKYINRIKNMVPHVNYAATFFTADFLAYKVSRTATKHMIAAARNAVE